MRMDVLALVLLPCLVLGGGGYRAATHYYGLCPGHYLGTPPLGKALDETPSLLKYVHALATLDMEAVMKDIAELLTDSQDCWPADYHGSSKIGQSYGGLFIRLAWHCAGSFRNTDGRGGCGGGRQRFPPESSWPDNGNLDKARGLLWPIKEKYGDALSWGDLFILAGTTSIAHMGGPVDKVCVGRIDDEDGTASNPLGPGPEQPDCLIQGACKKPLGTSTVGLIYVNPEGFMGVPDPDHSAMQIRNVFSRMGMNDSETVALIGGGHAFGKSHGACPLGAGPGPDEQPYNPWPGKCGSGKGKDTATSGIEGRWTTDMFKWDNEYFELLDKYGHTYELVKGPGDKFQWYTPHRKELMMLTTDLALVYDKTYKYIVHDFATDISSLDRAFAAAWEKLTTQGGRWAKNSWCWTPPPYHFKSKRLY